MADMDAARFEMYRAIARESHRYHREFIERSLAVAFRCEYERTLPKHAQWSPMKKTTR